MTGTMLGLLRLSCHDLGVVSNDLHVGEVVQYSVDDTNIVAPIEASNPAGRRKIDPTAGHFMYVESQC